MSNASDQVTIIGGGPAGAVTAISLRKLGINCAVLSREEASDFKPGESLAPNICHLLRELGLANVIQDPIHLEYTGNTVVWGDREPLSRHFFTETFGNGLHLDRLLFEAQLKEEAQGKGVLWLENFTLAKISFEKERLWVQGTDSKGVPESILAAYVVDCTGRASVVGRGLRIRKKVIDKLMAYCFVLQRNLPFFQGNSYVEAVSDGWWYVAPLPHGCLVVNFMSDSDLHIINAASIREWILRKLADTDHLKEQLQITDPGELMHIRVRTATTSFLEQPVGDRWLAVGDALCTYDPLTSFGLTIAIAGGRQAALAISRHLNGDSNAVTKYAAIQQITFNTTMDMLKHQYNLESRWRNSTFWQRRG